MRLLILGGTVFLGRHLVEDAVARGWSVTCFSRGLHGSVPTGVEHRIGDRGGDLSALGHGEWDLVVDTCGFDPAHVAASSRLLADRTRHYTFVSSISVYPDWPSRRVDETAPVHESGDEYGALKAECERQAEAAMAGRVLHVRAGLIVGAHDNIGRLPWWIERMARGGPILAPAPPDRPLQWIDARDLARWMLDLGSAGTTGVFDAVSPPGLLTFGELLAGSDVTWVDEDFLVDQSVEPWTELPLWLPSTEYPGVFSTPGERARAAGLSARPAGDTIAHTRDWLAGREQPTGYRSDVAAVGLAPDRETALLEAWASGATPS